MATTHQGPQASVRRAPDRRAATLCSRGEGYVRDQATHGGPRGCGNIIDSDELREDPWMHCIPEGADSMGVEGYLAFLAERRRLMAQRIKTYFRGL